MQGVAAEGEFIGNFVISTGRGKSRAKFNTKLHICMSFSKFSCNFLFLKRKVVLATIVISYMLII